MTIGAQILVQDGTTFKPIEGGLANAITEIRVEQHLDDQATFAIRFQEDFTDGKTQTSGHEQLRRRAAIAILVPRNADAKELVCLLLGQIEQSDFDVAIGGVGSWFEIRGRDIRTSIDRKVEAQQFSGSSNVITTQLVSDLGDIELSVEPGVLEFPEASNYYRFHGSLLDGLAELARISNLSLWLTYAAEPLKSGDWKITSKLHLEPSPRRSKAEGGPDTPLAQLALVESPLPRLVILSGDESETVVNFKVGTDFETTTLAKASSLDYEGNPSEAEVRETNVDDTNAGGRPPGDGDSEQNSLDPSAPGSPDKLQKLAEAAVTEGHWFVHAETLTSAYMLGAVLQPHDLVRVVGAGCDAAGVYQVRDVTHVINAAEHWMQVDLRTNSLPKEQGHA